MISNRDDPCAVLGVARAATPAEIGNAYRAFLRRHHPDTRSPDDDNAHDLALREVLYAYADLHDRARRDAHDRDHSVRQVPPPAVAQTQPTVVLGNVGPPPIAVTPTWIRPHGSRPAGPAPINLLIAFLEAFPPRTLTTHGIQTSPVRRAAPDAHPRTVARRPLHLKLPDTPPPRLAVP